MAVIPFEDEYVTLEQATAIVEILVRQCDLIEASEVQNELDFPELYDDDYLNGRKHSYTGYVYSGFQENTPLPAMTIAKRKYGRIHYLPQIESDTAVIQIYSSEATLDINEIKEKCAEYNVEGNEKRFCVFQFWTSKRGHLTHVDLVHFNSDAEQISRTEIFKFRARPIRAAA